MKIPKHITTARLAELTGKHPFRIAEYFGPAQVGRRFDGKLYSVEGVCDILSDASGVRVFPSDLFELITCTEGAAILKQLGKPRAPMSFRYWTVEGHVRGVRVGKRLRYVKSELIAFAESLPCVSHRAIGL